MSPGIRPSRWLATAVLMLTLASTAPAASGDAEGLLRRAIAAFNAGELKAATRALRRARGATEAPRLLAQIYLWLALVRSGDNRDDEAGQALRMALAYDPKLTIDRQRTKPELVALFDRIRGALQGRLEVTADGPGRAVQIDGEPAGRTPFGRALFAGRYRVEVLGGGGQALAPPQVAVVAAGRTTKLGFRAQPSPRKTGQRPARRRLWTWVAGGGAVVAAALALGFGAAAAADHDDACGLLANPSLPCDQRTRLADPSQQGRYDDLRSAVGREQTTANVAWAVAGGLAATTALLWILEPLRGRRPARPRRSTKGLGVATEIVPWVGPATGVLLQLHR